MKENSLAFGIVNVFRANIFKLVLSALVSFILPAVLNVSIYADIKTFQLYVSYIGILHFGYIDGMYIKYGGQKIKTIDRDELASSISTIHLFEIIVMLMVLYIAFTINSQIYIAFALTVLPLNLSSYFQMFYTAIGEFRLYSSIITITTLITSIMELLFAILFKVQNSKNFLIMYVAIYYAIWIYLEIQFRKNVKINIKRFCFNTRIFMTNVKSGILLTLGNLSSYIYTGMDRWFVKILLTTTDFAQYSFAVTLESFVSVALTPLSITFYNFFCKENNVKKIRSIRNCVSIISSYIIAAFFSVKLIINLFIPGYSNATNVLSYLIAAQIFYFPVKCVFINLYKARKQQTVYFAKLIISVVIGFIFNILCFYVFRNKEAMAIGTILSAFFWWLICSRDFKDIPYGIKEVFYILFSLVGFIMCNILFDAHIGLVIYILIITVLTYFLLNNEVKLLISKLNN